MTCTGQAFIDQASAHGLTVGPNGNSWGNGVSFYDIDGNGRDDITIYRNYEFLRYYLSTDEGFVSTQTDIFLGNNTLHLLWVDYDNDGDLDVIVSQLAGMVRLYQNQGDFEFIERTTQAGLTTQELNNYGLSFGDYDRDGDLDLYVCRYFLDDETGPATNLLYQNNGDGTFTDVTELLDVGDGLKQSFMAVWIDVNNDLWPDLFVINDRVAGNTLFLNNGDGTFTDVSDSAEIGLPFNDPMTATVGDFDNDSDLDIFMTNSGNLAGRPLMFLVNDGDTTFTELADEMGLSHDEITWGATWIDYDNDGWRDLFFVASDLIQNRLYQNIAGTTFANVQSELDSIAISRGYACATGDYNNDGHADIIINNLPPFQPQFLVNQGSDNHYIKLSLHGTVSNQQAIGSWIHVHRGAESYHHYTLCGENFTGQNSQNIIFGLGESDDPPDSIIVRYPSGHKDVYYDLEVDQLHHLTEGETYHVAISSSNGNGLCPGSSTILDAGIHSAYAWSTGDTTPQIEVTSAGNYEVIVFSEQGIQANAEINIAMYPAPIISAITVEPLCHGEASGSIVLTNNADVETDQVFWAHGATGTSLDSLPANLYHYTFTDQNGCSTEGEITLNEPSELVVLIQVTPETAGDDGSIYTAVFGGSPPYQITLNGDSTGSYLTNLAEGSYNLSVFDFNGCVVSAEIDISSSLDATMDEAKDFQLFPNPTTDFINIDYASPVNSARLMDVHGKTVWENASTGVRKIDIHHLPPGTYLCAIEFFDGTHQFEKVIKK